MAPAGGTVEAVVLPVSGFASALVPFSGGGLQSSATRCSTSLRSWILERVNNQPDFIAGRRIWRSKKVCRNPVVSLVFLGDGSMDPWLGDFPSVEKPSPSSKACGGAVAAARHGPVAVVVFVGVQKGLVCNFFMFSGSFCKNGISI
jgi:hypothetical protein